MGPPAGVASAGSLYKSDPSQCIGTWRRKWSQSPVPPRTRRAYETHVSSGSTAMILGPINPATPCLVIDWILRFWQREQLGGDLRLPTPHRPALLATSPPCNICLLGRRTIYAFSSADAGSAAYSL